MWKELSELFKNTFVKSISTKRMAHFLTIWAKWARRGQSQVTIAQGLQFVYQGKLEYRVATDISHALDSGRRMTSALEGWLPPKWVTMLAISESLPDFSDRLERIAKDMQEVSIIRKAVLSKLAYVLFLIIAVSGLLINIVDGELAGLLHEINLEGTPPFETRALLSIAAFLANYWIFMVSVAVLIGISLYIGLDKWPLPVARFCGSIWPLTSWRDLSTADLLIVLGGVARASGYTWISSAERVRVFASAYQRELLNRFTEKLHQGRTLEGALQSWPGISASARWQLKGAEADADFADTVIEVMKDEQERIQKDILVIAEGIKYALSAVTGLVLLLIFTGSWGMAQALA